MNDFNSFSIVSKVLTLILNKYNKLYNNNIEINKIIIYIIILFDLNKKDMLQ